MVALRYISVCFFIFLISKINSQSLQEMEIEMAYHADVMVNASTPRHRTKAMDQFNTLFAQALAKEASFDFPFDSLKWISKKYPADMSFKIYTWEVKVADDEVKYFGVIQKKDGTTFTLKDDFKNAEGLADEEYSHENWLGALFSLFLLIITLSFCEGKEQRKNIIILPYTKHISHLPRKIILNQYFLQISSFLVVPVRFGLNIFKRLSFVLGF